MEHSSHTMGVLGDTVIKDHPHTFSPLLHPQGVGPLPCPHSSVPWPVPPLPPGKLLLSLTTSPSGGARSVPSGHRAAPPRPQAPFKGMVPLCSLHLAVRFAHRSPDSHTAAEGRADTALALFPISVPSRELRTVTCSADHFPPRSKAATHCRWEPHCPPSTDAGPGYLRRCS